MKRTRIIYLLVVTALFLLLMGCGSDLSPSEDSGGVPFSIENIDWEIGEGDQKGI